MHLFPAQVPSQICTKLSETPFPCWRLTFGWTMQQPQQGASIHPVTSGHSSSMPRLETTACLTWTPCPYHGQGKALTVSQIHRPCPLQPPGVSCPCSPRRSLATLDDWLFIAMLSSVTCPSWPLLYSQTWWSSPSYTSCDTKALPLQSGSHSFLSDIWLPTTHNLLRPLHGS